MSAKLIGENNSKWKTFFKTFIVLSVVALQPFALRVFIYTILYNKYKYISLQHIYCN